MVCTEQTIDSDGRAVYLFIGTIICIKIWFCMIYGYKMERPIRNKIRVTYKKDFVGENS